MFTDRVEIECSAGKGGDGAVAWIRAKFIPKGGPCGGKGGKGGSIYLRAVSHLTSLDPFRNKAIIKAQNGQPGGKNLCTGKNGQDLVLDVPLGTLVKNLANGEILADLSSEGTPFLLCKGGKGGRGNDSFKTPTHRAPHLFTPGEPGESYHLELELKVIADVGLIGFPNAGKSTLITRLTTTRAKVAAYPFTTLTPNVGYIERDDFTRVILADIPGLIEGAHLNRGLGFSFLRHVERTHLLLYVLDSSGIDGRDPVSDFQVLRKELKAYSPELLEKPYMIALNKIDDEAANAHVVEFQKTFPKEKFFLISALTGEGLSLLQKSLLESPYLRKSISNSR